MKKFTIALLYALIFLSTNFTNVSTDFTNNLSLNDDKLVEIKNESNIIEENVSELKEEQELLDNQQEEIQTESYNDSGSYDVIQTSVAEDYNDSHVQNTVTYGTYGRLYVSWYDVALYDYNVNTYSDLDLQQIVDNYDSAAFYASHGRLVIADHDTQGFSVLTSLYEGATSYIQFGDGSSIGYRLIRKEFGYNTGPDLVDTAGNSFFDYDSDLIMYTCYNGGIMVTLWSLM